MNIENIDDNWLKELYSVIPPPLPLRNITYSRKDDSPSPNRRVKLPHFEPPSIFHEELCKQQESTERPITPPRETKKTSHSKRTDQILLDFIQEKREISESTSVYCSCKNRPDPYLTFKKYLENYIAPIPLFFKDHSDDLFKHANSLSRFQFVYIKQRPGTFKQYINVLQDPWLPIYNEGEVVNSGVCDLHRPGLHKRQKLRTAALDVSEFVFDSEFESGNLDKVIKSKDNEFNLFLTADTNTKGHTQ